MPSAVSDRTLARTKAADTSQGIDPDDGARYAKLRTEAATFEEVKRAKVRTSARGYTPHAGQGVVHRLLNPKNSDGTPNYEARPDVMVLNWGRRAGKSLGCAAAEDDLQQRDCYEKRAGLGRWSGEGPQVWTPGGGRSPTPFLHYMSVAPTYAMLGPNKRALQQMCGHVDDPGGGWIVHQTDQRWWFLGGICRDWRTGENPKRLVGEGLDGVSIDEAARVKAEVWTEHLQPALADHGGWALLRSTPLGRQNWFYKVWALGDPEAIAQLREDEGSDLELDPHVKCVQCSTMDNTAVPRLIKWAQRMKGRMPLAMWRRSFLASWSAFVGQCFDLDESRHRVKMAPSLGLHGITAGFDPGFTRGAAFAIGGADYDGKLYELETIARKQLHTHNEAMWRNDEPGCWTVIARQMLNRWGQGLNPAERWRQVPLYLPADPPGERRIWDALGFNMEHAYQNKRDRLDFFSLATADDAFGITSGSAWRSFESMQYPDDAAAKDAEIWDKRKSFDEPFDAIAYAFSEQVSEGYVPSGSGEPMRWSSRR